MGSLNIEPVSTTIASHTGFRAPITARTWSPIGFDVHQQDFLISGISLYRAIHNHLHESLFHAEGHLLAVLSDDDELFHLLVEQVTAGFREFSCSSRIAGLTRLPSRVEGRPAATDLILVGVALGLTASRVSGAVVL